jgi:hypothetical protein
MNIAVTPTNVVSFYVYCSMQARFIWELSDVC